MTILAKRSGTNFIPCPAGMHQAVCVDVIDNGVVENKQYNKKQLKVTLRWQVSEQMDDGRPFIVQRRYTNSLDPKAALRQDLESWRGRKFTPEEEAGFDLERLLHVNCMLNVVHQTGQDGAVWARVAAVTPPVKGLPKLVPHEYIREQDREPQEMTEPEIDDDPVPF